MELAKVRNGIATREPLPDFLFGLAPTSLVTLLWTDPSLGVQDCAWWPIVDGSKPLGPWQAYGAEALVVHAVENVVVSIKTVIDTPPTEPQFLAAVDGMLAEGARRKGYDSIYTASIRAGYPGPFHNEGVSYATWMDSVYSTCYDLLGKVKGGAMAYPASTDALLAQLPQCPFPANSAGG